MLPNVSNRRSTLRERKIPARFTDDDAHNIYEQLSPPSSSSRVARTRNSTTGTSSNHQSTDTSSSIPSSPPPDRDVTFLITKPFGPGYVMGYKEGNVLYPTEWGNYESSFHSHIRTDDKGVTYIQQVRECCGKFPSQGTEIIFDRDNVWKSRIKTAEELGIVKPTLLGKFLKPRKSGNSNHKILTFEKVTYIWSYDDDAKSYTMTENKKDKQETICHLQLLLHSNLVGNNLSGATLTIYDHETYKFLEELLISCAVIFLNDWKKYVIGSI